MLSTNQIWTKPDSQGPKPPKTGYQNADISKNPIIQLWILEGKTKAQPSQSLSTTGSPRMTTIDDTTHTPKEEEGEQGSCVLQALKDIANKLRIDSIESTNTAGSAYVCSNFMLNFAAWLNLPVAFKAFKRLTVVCETK